MTNTYHFSPNLSSWFDTIKRVTGPWAVEEGGGERKQIWQQTSSMSMMVMEDLLCFQSLVCAVYAVFAAVQGIWSGTLNSEGTYVTRSLAHRCSQGIETCPAP